MRHLPSLANRAVLAAGRAAGRHVAGGAGPARGRTERGSQACQRHDKNTMYFSLQNLISSSCKVRSRRKTVLESL